MWVEEEILNRDTFRNSVFERDGHMCVVCRCPATDAHHIIERRLWETDRYHPEGYVIENGASLCAEHHYEAEMTLISCNELRQYAGIKNTILPDHFEPDEEYDKWGNVILPTGHRTPGELFDDPSVQKILEEAGALGLFITHVKYPKTAHLPWSPGKTRDDRVLRSVEFFEGKNVIATVKLDGENATLYNDYYHARSLDSGHHPSRSWLKNFHAGIAHDIPDRWRICGENLFAKHSILYKNLRSYFYGYSIWNEKNTCLSWKETMEWFELLGIEHAPILYVGMWKEEEIKSLFKSEHEGNEMEGYVVRITDGFSYRDFKKYVAKYVRKDHVKTSQNWMRSRLVQNELA